MYKLFPVWHVISHCTIVHFGLSWGNRSVFGVKILQLLFQFGQVILFVQDPTGKEPVESADNKAVWIRCNKSREAWISYISPGLANQKPDASAFRPAVLTKAFRQSLELAAR